MGIIRIIENCPGNLIGTLPCECFATDLNFVTKAPPGESSSHTVKGRKAPKREGS